MRREQLLRKGPAQTKVMAFLGDGERRFMEISRACGIEKNVLGFLLNRWLNRGDIERVRRGVYRVAA